MTARLRELANECRKPYPEGAHGTRYADGYNDACNDIADQILAILDADGDGVRSERESGFLPPLAQKAARDCVSHNRNRLRKYLAAQTRAVPDGDDALCKLAEKYGDEGGRPA